MIEPPSSAGEDGWWSWEGVAMPSERIQRQIDRLLDQADEAAAARNWALVRELCERIQEFDPDNADAHTNLGAVFLTQGSHDLADREFRAALQLNPDHLLAREGLRKNAVSVGGQKQR